MSSECKGPQTAAPAPGGGGEVFFPYAEFQPQLLNLV